MTACSDGSSSGWDVPADDSSADGRPAPAVPRPRTPGPLDPPPRPRITEEPAILGLSRLTRGRFGSRLFNAFFVLVFALIIIQMISALLENPW